MKRVAALMSFVALAGCAAQPAPAPRYAPMDAAPSLAAVRERINGLKTVQGEATITLTKPYGDAVRLDGAYLLAPPGSARLRAWKLGTAVFDLTLRGGQAWAYVPRDEARPAAPNLRQSLGRWLTLIGDGELFTGEAEVIGDTIRLARPEGDGLTLRCEIDRPTLTPRRYTLVDSDGVERFSLTLADYRPATGGQVWPWSISAISASGVVDIRTSAVEVNSELPASAFTPPARAEALP